MIVTNEMGGEVGVTAEPALASGSEAKRDGMGDYMKRLWVQASVMTNAWVQASVMTNGASFRSTRRSTRLWRAPRVIPTAWDALAQPAELRSLKG